jgi:hypothetical protein
LVWIIKKLNSGVSVECSLTLRTRDNQKRPRSLVYKWRKTTSLAREKKKTGTLRQLKKWSFPCKNLLLSKRVSNRVQTRLNETADALKRVWIHFWQKKDFLIFADLSCVISTSP